MSERKRKGEERKEKFLEKNTIGYYRNKPVIRVFGRYMYIDDKGRSKPIPPSQLKKWKDKQKAREDKKNFDWP